MTKNPAAFLAITKSTVYNWRKEFQLRSGISANYSERQNKHPNGRVLLVGARRPVDNTMTECDRKVTKKPHRFHSSKGVGRCILQTALFAKRGIARWKRKDWPLSYWLPCCFWRSCLQTRGYCSARRITRRGRRDYLSFSRLAGSFNPRSATPKALQWSLP